MSCRSGVIRSSGTQIGGEDAWASLRVCESESVSHVQLFATPWTPAMGLYLARLLSLQNSLGKNTGVDSHSCLQGIFPTQGSNTGLLNCRQVLYLLSHQAPKTRVYLHAPILGTISASQKTLTTRNNSKE